MASDGMLIVKAFRAMMLPWVYVALRSDTGHARRSGAADAAPGGGHHIGLALSVVSSHDEDGSRIHEGDGTKGLFIDRGDSTTPMKNIQALSRTDADGGGGPRNTLAKYTKQTGAVPKRLLTGSTG